MATTENVVQYLLRSCVAEVTDRIFLVLHTGVGLMPTPICKMTMIYKTTIPRKIVYKIYGFSVTLWLVVFDSRTSKRTMHP